MIDTAEKTREHLAELVEDFNASTDPAERTELYLEMEELRSNLRELEVVQ